MSIDKHQDSRNKIVDCTDCKIVIIYESNTQIVVKIGSEDPKLLPKNSLTFEIGSDGKILIKNKCCSIVATACDASYVRKENGDIYSENYDELIVLLSVFLGFNSGGGGGVLGAENGNYLAGDKVRQGGSLIEDTTITEDGFDFTADREEDLYPGSPYYGSAITYYKSEIGQPLPDLFPVNSLNRKIGVEAINVDGITIDSSAELGVFGDDYYESGAYFKANQGTSEMRFVAAGNAARIQALTSGVVDTQVLVNNNVINLNAGTALVSVAKNGAILISSLNQSLSLDFSQINTKLREAGGQQIDKIEIPLDFTLIANGIQDIYTIPLDESDEYTFILNLQYKHVGDTGRGWVDGRSGGYRPIAGSATLIDANVYTIGQENILGPSAIIHHAVSGNDYIIQVNRNSITSNVRFVGTLTLTKTNFTI